VESQWRRRLRIRVWRARSGVEGLGRWIVAAGGGGDGESGGTEEGGVVALSVGEAVEGGGGVDEGVASAEAGGDGFKRPGIYKGRLCKLGAECN